MMNTLPTTIECQHCHKSTHYHVDKINHLKQLGLTLVTCGIWLPMWILSTFVKVKICDECGKPNYESM